VSTYTSSERDVRRAGAAAAYDAYDDDSGAGWLAFAAILLLMLGVVNFIEGVAAIGNAHFFVHNTNYVIGSLNTWGWVALCIGLVQLLIGLGLFTRNQFARWGGVGVLSIGAIVQLLMLPAYPLWGLMLFATNVFALYGLIAHGDRG
jgi:hypothetical protein